MHTRPRRCKDAANSPFQRGIFRNPIAFSCQHKHSASPQEIVAKACARRKAFNARNAQHARCIRYQVRKHHSTNGWSSMEQETQWGPNGRIGQAKATSEADASAKHKQCRLSRQSPEKEGRGAPHPCLPG